MYTYICTYVHIHIYYVIECLNYRFKIFGVASSITVHLGGQEDTKLYRCSFYAGFFFLPFVLSHYSCIITVCLVYP